MSTEEQIIQSQVRLVCRNGVIASIVIALVSLASWAWVGSLLWATRTTPYDAPLDAIISVAAFCLGCVIGYLLSTASGLVATLAVTHWRLGRLAARYRAHPEMMSALIRLAERRGQTMGTEMERALWAREVMSTLASWSRGADIRLNQVDVLARIS